LLILKDLVVAISYWIKILTLATGLIQNIAKAIQ
jgi:hypothetical protein